MSCKQGRWTLRINARLAQLESAIRAIRPARFSEMCLCFPADEQPEFRWQADAEEAAKVLCPLHGRRFQTVVTRFLYRARRFSVVDFEKGWPHRSAQYQKAMRASLNPALASAKGATSQELVLRDGRKIECDIATHR
jgi:hypothetical protein